MKKTALFLMLVSVGGALFAACGTGFGEYTGTEYLVVEGACPDGYTTVYTNELGPAKYTGGTVGTSTASSCVFGS
jgi:hypothetical protein